MKIIISNEETLITWIPKQLILISYNWKNKINTKQIIVWKIYSNCTFCAFSHRKKSQFMTLKIKSVDPHSANCDWCMFELIRSKKLIT